MIDSVADLVEDVEPFIGQDFQLKYRVRTDRNLNVDATITGYTIKWLLFADEGDAAAIIEATATVVSPYATVSANASAALLTAGTTYKMQLWRADSGNTYPLTGFGLFTPKASPAAML